MTSASSTSVFTKGRSMTAFSPARMHATVIQLILLAMIILAALTVPNFASASNISAILYTGAPVGVVAIGLALITLSGNLFVLSLSATAALASIIFAMLSSGSLPAAILATLLAGAVVGLILGVVVVSFRSNPIITSIAAASLISAIAQYLSSGRTVLIDADTGWLGNGALVSGLPYQALIFVVLALILEFIIERSRTGRELRLTGMNKAAAALAGIRTSRAAMLAYLIAGTAAAAAGVMIAAQAGAGNLRVGQDLDFSAIAAVLIGGVGIKGGRGRVLDAAVGAIFVAVLSNILLVNGFSYEVQLMVKGLAVIGSVMLGAALSRERN
ncbi:ABC transporter permease [Martelella sp. HB161492]|uniref:ABC transporter permease n=1 Tax=Martelella sp. HB161492 TaxID=2720726 RepID=UPI001591B92F|nr:ABC transporter permease [Martelella sp. HB161492]